jgi:hypothetical protein
VTSPVPATFTDTVLDAADLNTGVRDPITWAIERAFMRAHAAATQSIGDSSWTSLNLATEDVDRANGAASTQHSTSSQTSRFTCVYAGWYLACPAAAFASNGTGRRGVRIAVNASPLDAGGVIMQANTSSGINGFPGGSDLVFLNVGDYVEVQGFQSSTGSLNASAASGDINTRLNMIWIGNA